MGKTRPGMRRAPERRDSEDEQPDAGGGRRTPRAHKPMHKYSPAGAHSHQQPAKKRAREAEAEDSDHTGSESEEGKSSRPTLPKRVRRARANQTQAGTGTSSASESENEAPLVKGLAAAGGSRQPNRPITKPAARQAPTDREAAAVRSRARQLKGAVSEAVDAFSQLAASRDMVLEAMTTALDAADAFLAAAQPGPELKEVVTGSGLNKLLLKALSINTSLLVPLAEMVRRAGSLKDDVVLKCKTPHAADGEALATNGTAPACPPAPSTAPPSATPPPMTALPAFNPTPAAPSSTPAPLSAAPTAPLPLSAPATTPASAAAQEGHLQVDVTPAAASQRPSPDNPTPGATPAAPPDTTPAAGPPLSCAAPGAVAAPSPLQPLHTTGDPARDRALTILTACLAPAPTLLDPAAAAGQLEAELYRLYGSPELREGALLQYKRHLHHLWHVLHEHSSIPELLLLGAVSCQQAVHLIRPSSASAAAGS